MKNTSNWLISVALMAALNLQGQNRKLSLSEALTIAKENNKRLKLEILQASSAYEETNLSKAVMLPTISVAGGYSYYLDKQVIFMPGAFTGNETEPVVGVKVGGLNAFSTQISLHQPIVSEAARRQVKVSRINESIEKLDVQEHRTNLVMDVTATYYKVMLISETIKLNKQSLERNLRSLDDSRMLLLQGRSLKIDTLKNFVIAENLKTNISFLENEKKVVLLHLQQILGISQHEQLLLTDSLKPDAEIQNLTASEFRYNDAIQNRPDIQIKSLNVELGRNLLSQSRAQRLPTLSLVAAYQIQAQADDRNLEAYHWPKTSFIGLQASVPIFSGNRINSRIRQSTIQLQSSILSLDDATEKANTEIESVSNILKDRFQRLSVQERTVQAAEVNFKIVNDRYKNGISSRLELSDAELTLTEAKLNQLQLIFSAKIAKLQLDKALGILEY